jgi:hypothetical protein
MDNPSSVVVVAYDTGMVTGVGGCETWVLPQGESEWTFGSQVISERLRALLTGLTAGLPLLSVFRG